MSNFPSYPTRSFSETQKFFVLDPQTGTPSFVLGSDLVDFLTPGTSFVFSESTRVSAQASNYKVGNLIQTAGAVTEGDGLASGFLVVPGGEGDFAMQNGNDLLVIRGDDLLREQLKEGVVRMPDLAAMESTPGRFDGDAARLVSGTGRDGDFRWDASDLSSTLVLASATSDSVDDTTDTINDADHPFSDGDGVITQTTVNGLTAQTVYWVVNSTSGTYQLSATFGGGAVDLTGTTNVTIDHLLDPLQGVYVVSDRTGASGAWVRQYSGAVNVKWFGSAGDWNGTSGTDDTQPIKVAIAFLSYGQSLFFPRGEYLITNTIALSDIRGGRIFGEGVGQFGDNGTSIVWQGGSTLPMFTADFLKGVEVTEITFVTTDTTTNRATACVEFTKTTESGSSGPSSFRRCWFVGTEYGVLLGSTDYDNTYNVSEILFEECRFEARYGVYNAGVQTGGQNVNNVFKNCHFGGTLAERFFWLDGGNIIAENCTFNGSSSGADSTVLYITGDVTLGVPSVFRSCYAEQVTRCLATEFTSDAALFARTGMVVFEGCWWNINKSGGGTNYMVECYKSLEIEIRDCVVPSGDFLYSPPANQSALGFSSLAPAARNLRFEGRNAIGGTVSKSRGGYVLSSDREIRSDLPEGTFFPSASTLTLGDAIQSLPAYKVFAAYGTNGSFNIDTIVNGKVGDKLYLQGLPGQVSFRTPVVRHNIDNIYTQDGTDVVLNADYKMIILEKLPSGDWYEVGRLI